MAEDWMVNQGIAITMRRQLEACRKERAHLRETNADLLAALEAAVAYLEDDSRSPRRRQACLAGFRAAIAKARGTEGA